ncbi:FAD-dependent oxidoreductase [Xanthobacter autotrophicus NCIMB 11399]
MDRPSESPGATLSLPVAIIGAGPVGLAAAAHLLARGLTPLVFERGAGVGTSLKAWGHVRVFSPWAYNISTRPPAHCWRKPSGARLTPRPCRSAGRSCGAILSRWRLIPPLRRTCGSGHR